MKKRIALLLALVMLIATLTACGKGDGGSSDTSTPDASTSTGGDDASTGNTGGGSSGGIEVTPAGELPIVNEEATLKIFMYQNVNVEDYVNNKFTKWMQEQTGVTLDIYTVPEKDVLQKVNLMLASNTDLPDVFNCSLGITNDMVADMADQGIFIQLDEIIEEYGYWYKEALADDPLIETIMKLPDGHQYTLPRIVKSVPNETSGRAWINQNWLDALNLDTPTTTDELADVLRAFKSDDPNGNGKADEIPYVGASQTGWHSNPDEFLMNSFIQYNRDMPFYIDDDGKFQASFDKDEYRNGLIYMNMLCSEGLLDPASFTQDQTQLKQIFANEDIALVGLVPGGGTFQYDSMDGERVREYNPLSPMKGPEGVQLAWYNPYGSYDVKSWIITSACENPEMAFRVGDLMYSREAAMRNRLGEPEVDYAIPENGEIGVDGEPATYQPILLWGSIQKSHWNEVGPTYNNFDNNCVKEDNPYELQQYLWNATADYYTEYVPDVKNCYNPLTFYTFDDARQMADVWSTLKDYQRESLAKFVTGVLDPNNDSDWEQYLGELESIGYLNYIEIVQTRLDNQ